MRAWSRSNTNISIHTPLAGSDDLSHGPVEVEDISIHTPLAGSDQTRQSSIGIGKFQSTLPLRGATTSF